MERTETQCSSPTNVHSTPRKAEEKHILRKVGAGLNLPILYCMLAGASSRQRWARQRTAMKQ